MEQNSVGWLRASIRLKELQYRASRPDMEIKSSAAASITFSIDKFKRMLYKMYSMENITEKRLTVDHNGCIEMHNEDCWKRKPGITSIHYGITMKHLLGSSTFTFFSSWRMKPRVQRSRTQFVRLMIQKRPGREPSRGLPNTASTYHIAASRLHC